MDLTEIVEFLKVFNGLPNGWKVIFVTVFFLIPKLIQILGGGKIVQAAFKIIWDFIVEVVRKYQARKQRQIENRGLTEAYTRTLVVESLNIFSARLKTIEEKIDRLVTRDTTDASLKKIRNLVETSKRKSIADDVD